ncbi:MAG: hypothetical protein ACI3ZK_00520 [Candidatus Cryptobacteroides sp.]
MKLKLYSILSLLLCLAACTPQDLTPEPAQAASLSLNLSVPGLRIETKGNADDPFADDISSWTDWEKVLDGRMLYRLTVFLIAKDSEYLVAYRDIYYSTYSGSDVTSPSAEEGPNGWYNGTSVDVSLASSTQAQLSFLYDHPLHKAGDGSSFEQLQRGTYRLLAVANYSGVNGTKFNGQPASVASYTGLGGGSFDASVDGIISEFKTCQENNSPKKFSEYSNHDAFINYILTSSSSTFICRPMPQPLTLAKEIKLNPGMNSISGELLRSFSRIRLSVENLANVDLTLDSLKFSDNTTRDQTYLFDLPDYPDRIYEVGTKGKPSANSSDAIVPFVNKTVLSKLSAGDNIKTVFDAYILESRDLSNDYTYKLNLEYVGEAPAEYFSSVSSTPINDKSALSDGSYYVIMNQANNKWILTAGTDVVGLLDIEIADLTLPIHNEYIWQLQSQGSADSYYIKTVGATTYYIGEPQANANGLPLTPTESKYFVMENSAQSHIGMKVNSSSSGHSYINVNYPGSKVGGWVYLDGDLGSQFDFYEVSKTLVYPKYATPIKLTTIDPVTSVVSPVHTIKRNDFINVFVSVSYNKDFGSFEFEVKPWNEVSGDIEFN